MGHFKNKNIFTFAFLAAFITLLSYLPSLRNGFISNWDDGMYVLMNPHIRTFDMGFLKWVFTTHFANNWHPLTIISYALDYLIFGLNPFIYHLTNIIFHALNTFLVAVLAFKLISKAGIGNYRDNPDSIKGGALKASFITALLFGLHPLHVESVTWISERKDVLYSFFYLLSILAYLKYVSGFSKERYYTYYAAAFFFFSLSLMSKPMAVSLPIVLLILDYYPIGRLNTGSTVSKWSRLQPILEKVPFFILSLTSGRLAVWAQGSSVVPLRKIPFLMRIVVAVRAYMFYLYKMIMPVKLAPLYPYPTTVDLFTYEYMGALVIFLFFTVLSLATIKKYRFLPASWLYFVITLLPVIGLVQVGDQVAADRYTYLASLGPLILISVGTIRVLETMRERKVLTAVFSSVIVMIFLAISFLTVRQENKWKDAVTLWGHEIEVYPSSSRGYDMRGLAYQDLNDSKRALRDYDYAIALDPSVVDVYNNRGIAYGNLGIYEPAIKDFSKAIELNPGFIEAYNNRGYTYLKLGDYKKAVEDIGKALELNPLNAGTSYNLGSAYSKLGDSRRAEFYFRKASLLGGKPKQ